MKQDKAVSSALKSIQQVSGNNFTHEQLALIGSHFYMVYGAGYVEGTKRLNGRERVIMIYKNGVKICERDSVVEAGKYTETLRTTVSEAMRKGSITRKGFSFKYR